MSYRIANSNQFASWSEGEYLSTSDLLVGAPGSELPSTPSDTLSDDDLLSLEIALRRNSFDNEGKPKGYKSSSQVLNMPYAEQVSYINKLSNSRVSQWYGASDRDVEGLSNYLSRFGAYEFYIDKEKRIFTASMKLGDFKQAFLSSNQKLIVNLDGQGNFFYYDPLDFSNSYLETRGDGAESAAAAIIGIHVDIQSNYQGENQADDADSSNSVEEGLLLNEIVPAKTRYTYYPTEVGKQYSFPKSRKTNGGHGVTIGLVGTGGNQFDNVFGQNNILKKYLKAQGINPNRLGRLISPNSPEEFTDPEWYGESAMDYSILRSIAPRADIIVSDNDVLYEQYLELIYDPRVDLISSSEGGDIAPGSINQRDAYHELFVDALLRGKPVIVAAGDRGSANNYYIVPQGESIPDFFSGDSAVLAVGGTAFSNKSQRHIYGRPQVSRPTVVPPVFNASQIDKVTGLISSQYVWNEDTIKRITPEIMERFQLQPYPGLDQKFSADDLSGSVVLEGYFFNTIGSSGAFTEDTIPMPNWQSQNLGEDWLGTGRIYPDISVLAGGNQEKGSNSNYYVFTAQPNRDKTGYEPVLSTFGGGTSAGAPLITGLLANITSYVKGKFGKAKKLGMISPLLYESYDSRDKSQLFIDVPSGSNNANVVTVASSPDDWSGYSVVYEYGKNKYLIPVNGTGPGGAIDTNLSSTGPGFDAATGFGSVNGEVLLSQIARVFSDL